MKKEDKLKNDFKEATKEMLLGIRVVKYGIDVEKDSETGDLFIDFLIEELEKMKTNHKAKENENEQ